MATVPPFVPDPDASFSQIIVPTSDTVRYNYLLRILAAAGKHVLYVGETGTGDHNLLLFLGPRQAHLMTICSCSQCTTCLACPGRRRTIELHGLYPQHEVSHDCG